ncbi:MAG: T9SS type A sorting domain-containing protein [Ferruginibacter sp.]
MRKIYFLIFIILLSLNSITAQITYNWVGGATGDYQVAGNWSPARTPLATNDILAFNPSSPIVVNNVPNQTIGAIRINGNDSVSFATNSSSNILTLSAAVPLIYSAPGIILSADFLTINVANPSPFTMSSGTFGIAPSTGGKITINGALTLTAAAKLNVDVPGTGGTTISATGSITNTSGTFNCLNTGAIVWAGGSSYNHNVTGLAASAIPASSWITGSNCNIIGMNLGSAALTGLAGIDFANFTWDCANQVADFDLNLAGASVNINGTFFMKRTNSKYLRFAGATGGTISAGTYTQTNGNVMLQTSSGTTTLSIRGVFTHSSGILDAVGGSATGTGLLDFKGNVVKVSTWQASSSSSAAQMIVQFSGSTPQTVNLLGAWNAPMAGRCNVVINNSNAASGVILTSDSRLRVFNTSSSTPATCTMIGMITPGNDSAYIMYNGVSSLVYNGTNFQTATKTEFTVVAGMIPTNLVINNGLGVTFPITPIAFNRTIPGTLSMLTGNLAISLGNTLQLTNPTQAAQLSYTSGYITTGTLSRLFQTSGLPTSSADPASLFPFGNGFNNRSLNLFFSTSSLTGGTAGMVSVSHNALVNTDPISFADNGITLDKKTKTNWTISTGGFILGTATTASIITVGANIGSVDDYSFLRLTDGVTPNYGTLIPTTGTNAVPVVGKSGLVQADITSKTLSIGSDSHNPLVIIIFTWIGSSPANGRWDNAANWTGGVGYPSAATEVAIISSTTLQQPTIVTGLSVNVYQLTVSAGMTLTMQPSSGLSVYDAATFGGTAVFDSASTFTYASSNNDQNVLSLPYGSLAFSGTGQKIMPATVTVTGKYSITGASPNLTTNSNTFIYNGSGAQAIAAVPYYNLTIAGNRGGATITLGNPPVTSVVDIANKFDVSSLSNYTVPLPPGIISNSRVNFSSASTQYIPGFYYALLSNGNGPRVLDSLGSTDPNHVIRSRTFDRGSGAYTVKGSKVNFYVSGAADPTYTANVTYYDLEFSGNMNNRKINFYDGPIYINGQFSVTLTNFQQVANTTTYFVFNGTKDQTIPSFKAVAATNTPAFKFPNVIIQGGNRNIILPAADTISVTGSFEGPRAVAYNSSTVAPYTAQSITPFSAGKGFIVTGSTVKFGPGPSQIPLLLPAVAGTPHYNNVVISGGTHALESNMTIAGNLAVSGNEVTPGILNIGDGNGARVLTVLGNITDSGRVAGTAVTAQIDMNTGTTGTTKINLAGNLSIIGYGQLMGTTSAGAKNGVIVFNGTNPQTYSNTASATYKNGLVNFTVGDSTIATKLTLASSMDLLASVSSNRDTFTVSRNATLNCDIYNIVSTGPAGSSANFTLRNDATLITANTGGVEGTATSGTTGSIINDATIVKNYDPAANYEFNAAAPTNMSFPAVTTPFPMASLTVGNNVNPATFSLNKSIDVSNTLTLKAASTLAVSSSNLNLKSTAVATAKIAAVPASANITYGSGRFVVERYYPSRRAWRLITAPITADAGRTVFSSWQMAGANVPGSGTFVTGPGAVPGFPNGLDVSPQNNFSLKIFNATTGNQDGVADTKAQLLSGATGIAGTPDNLGMFLFVRGDRSSATLFNTAYSNTTTLRDTGRVQLHDQTFKLNAASGAWNVIGNPYASPVDITDIVNNTPNVNPGYFWAYDPYLNSEQGGYILLVYDGTKWESTPPSPGGLNGIIQSSQAFYVQKNSNVQASMVFNETKKSAQSLPGAFRPLSQPAKFATNLYLRDSDTSRTIADGTLVLFDESYNSAVDLGDGAKFGNTKETFYMVRNTKTLAVEKRQPVTDSDTLFFKLSKTTQRNYQFEFVPKNMNPLLTAFLEDSYKGTKTPVSVTSATTFNFSVNGEAKSAVSDRFRIVFKAAGAGPLPVTYSNIKAYQKSNDIAVEWTVENEIDINKYDVEKSIDGINFTKVNTTTAKGANAGTTNYGFLDVKVSQGNNFYRIVSYSKTGAVEYSRIVLVKIGKSAAGISIYPNPVKGNMIGVSFSNMEKGIYNVRLINTLGQSLLSKQIVHAAGSSMETITAGSQLTAGIYQLEIIAPDKTVSTVKVIAQ